MYLSERCEGCAERKQARIFRNRENAVLPVRSLRVCSRWCRARPGEWKRCGVQKNSRSRERGNRGVKEKGEEEKEERWQPAHLICWRSSQCSLARSLLRCRVANHEGQNRQKGERMPRADNGRKESRTKSEACTKGGDGTAAAVRWAEATNGQHERVQIVGT